MKHALALVIALLFILFFSCSKRETQGEMLYKANCASCHLEDGKGLGELIPNISEGDFLVGNRALAACIIRQGIVDDSKDDFTYSMPANQELSEVEITNILNYIVEKWHKDKDAFSLPEIKKSLKDCNALVL